jgi:cyanophycinase
VARTDFAPQRRGWSGRDGTLRHGAASTPTTEDRSRMSTKSRRGFVIPIGGAEEREHHPRILERFAELCGGAKAKLAVIPTASQLRTTGPAYEHVFHDVCHVGEVHVLNFLERRDAERRDWLEVLREVDGVFVTGGNQMRLTRVLGGTEVTELLRERNRRDGLHLAGTSAGAAFMSEHMIASGDEGPTPHEGMVQLASGLGVVAKVIVDQHFRQRDRFGRLMTAIAAVPQAIGIGLDEDTAAFIGPDDDLLVVGSGAVTVIDPAEMSFTSIDDAPPHAPLSVVNLKLHVLTERGHYDLKKRMATPPAPKPLQG